MFASFTFFNVQLVAILDMQPQLQYFATPSLQSKAYIQARAENNSPFPFLEADRVAIFFDGSFVTTTKLKETFPGEEINVFLGSDAGVKVTWQQVESSTGQGQEGGFFKGEQLSSHTFEYRTVIQNTKETPVNITIISVLPRSTDMQIIVSLEKPPIKYVQRIRSSDDMNAFKAFSTDGMVMDGKVCYLIFIFSSLYVHFSLQMSFLSSLSKIVFASFYFLF
jgi:uncharacterized protein (TIGR02231 family)